MVLNCPNHIPLDTLYSHVLLGMQETAVVKFDKILEADTDNFKDSNVSK